MDGLGRVIQTQGPYETAGVLVLTDTSYNARGLPLYSGLPRIYTSTGGSHIAPIWTSVPHTTSNYDALGRVTSVAYSGTGSGQETYDYSGLRTVFKDRNNHQKIQENDGFGRLVKVEEYTGSSPYTLYASTTYQYDVRDLLKQVTDATGNLTTITYNTYGRKTAMSDPDMGSWSYGYDVLGNLNRQTDARTCVTTIYYDDLNRATGKTYTGRGLQPTPDVTYTYELHRRRKRRLGPPHQHEQQQQFHQLDVQRAGTGGDRRVHPRKHHLHGHHELRCLRAAPQPDHSQPGQH